VRLVDDGSISFRDDEFDLVLNRHAAFNCSEVGRVLAQCGTFITQQVHGRSTEDLLAAFGASPQWPDSSPEKYVPRLQAAGLTVVDVRESEDTLRFSDVGAMGYWLKAIPWLVPDFQLTGSSKIWLACNSAWILGSH
jgi:hypothetical protein